MATGLTLLNLCQDIYTVVELFIPGRAMLPSSIRTALDLRAAIDSAPKKLEPIGSCVSMVDEWQEENGPESSVNVPVRSMDRTSS